jgi:hypothetical protein
MRILEHIYGIRHSTLDGLIFLFLLTGLSTRLHAGESTDLSTKTNLEVFRSQLDSLASELLQRANLGQERNLFLNVRSSDSSLVVRNMISEAFKRLRYNVFLASHGNGSEGAAIDLAFVEIAVRYGRAFRENILGGRKAERTISTVISANVRSAGNEVLFAGNLARTSRDTVSVGDIPDLENLSIPFTHGEAPEGGVFDNILAPAIIVGASAVVIYLFFTVRS